MNADERGSLGGNGLRLSLRATGLTICLLLNFGAPGVQVKRVVLHP